MSVVTVTVSPERSGQISKPIWPYLLVAALVVLFVEWYIYNKRVLV